MINDLINFGKWLDKNDQSDYGKTVKDNDWILKVNFKNDTFVLEDNFVKKEDFNPNYFESIFNNEVLFPDKPIQNYMIQSTNELPGFSPFFIRIVEKPTENKLNEFDSKIERSINSHFENGEFKGNFFKIFNTIYDDYQLNFFEKCLLNNNQKEVFIEFFDTVKLDEVNNLIKDYYMYIDSNKDKIKNFIIDVKNSDEYKNEGSFYLACVFENYYDLINDLLVYYCKFIKERNKKYPSDLNSVCLFCGNKGITYPSLPCFGPKNEMSFNLLFKTKFFKFRICKNCNFLISIAENKLKNLLNVPNLLIVPSNKSDIDFEKFMKIGNSDYNSFTKLNNFLKNTNEYNYDLIIYKQERAVLSIKRYIENYHAFLAQFENIYLYDNGRLKYLFNEKLSNEELENSKINNLFDLEPIFKQFFWDIKEGEYKFFNKKFLHFYQIYTMDLTGVKGIFNGFDSRIVALFTKYMDNIFSFIYEINLDALNRNMINEIVLNSLMKLEMNNKRDEKNRFKFGSAILKRLNYLFMFKKEFLGDNMLNEDNIKSLKDIFKNYNANDNEIEKLNSILINDPAIKYYLLGQFIRYIDDIKFMGGKNATTFSNFISNVNRSNIKKLFATEILHKYEFYIGRMSKKGKFIFEIFKNGYESLFNEKDFDYEDYLLLMFTGYYTKNILKKDNNGDAKNE